MFFSATIEASVSAPDRTTHLTQSRAHRTSVPSPSLPSRWTCTVTKSIRIASSACWTMLSRRAGFVPGLRAHQARGRPSGQEAGGRGGFKSAAIHGDRSQNQRNQALRGIPGRLLSRSGRHRRCRSRHPRGRHRARRELRSAAGARRLHPSRGTHGTRRRQGHRFDLCHTQRTFGSRRESSERSPSN